MEPSEVALYAIITQKSYTLLLLQSSYSEKYKSKIKYNNNNFFIQMIYLTPRMFIAI